MRLHAAAAFVLLAFGVMSAGMASGCSDDAVSVDACRLIETARCQASTACGLTQDDAAYCIEIYRDQCLHGLQNTKASPAESSVDACVGAIRATEACARAGATSMAECTAAPLVATVAPTSLSPCTIIQRRPEELSACSFVAAEVVDAGVPVPVDGGGDAADAGDAAPE